MDFAEDGTLYVSYANGARVPAYRVPLGNVISPDMLTPGTGNIFKLSAESGDLIVGFPTESGLGSLVSGALEQSTVDIGTELTEMIEAQRSYTANSKVFQTASELLDVLNNLKR
jgi:flagellar hook protein FlgE